MSQMRIVIEAKKNGKIYIYFCSVNSAVGIFLWKKRKERIFFDNINKKGRCG